MEDDIFEGVPQTADEARRVERLWARWDPDRSARYARLRAWLEAEQAREGQAA